MKSRFIVLSVCLLYLTSPCYGAEIYLKNGDRLSGKILKATEKTCLLETQYLGNLSIEKDSIQEAKELGIAPEPKPVKKWSGELAAGFDRQRGNTDKTNMNSSFKISRNTERHDFLVRGGAYYSEASKKMNTQKYDGAIRYDYKFGKKRRWFNFYEVAGSHSRFDNINARISPRAGIGYWLLKGDTTKLSAELGLGVTYTDYRENRDDATEFELVPRIYYEQLLFSNLTFSEEATMHPSVSDIGYYRFKSVTSLLHPVTNNIYLKFSFIFEKDSDPGPGFKENDYQFVSAIAYQF